MGDYDTIMEKSSEKINLAGHTVLPGFTDSHTHLVEMGLNMKRVDLSDCDTLEEAIYYLKKEADKKEEGEWIVGFDFDETKWKKNDYPDKKDLDEVSEEHPVIIRRICGHIAVINSLGLEKLDIDSENLDEGTGLIKEDILTNFDDIVGVTKEDRKEAIKRAIKRAQSLGVTSIHDIVTKEGWEAYKELDEEQDLDLRVRCYIHHDQAEDLEPVNKSEFLSLKGLKVFMDGSLGARTAALHEEYNDDPDNRGMLLVSEEELGDIIEEAEGKGFQLMVHAIGDRALSTALDAFEEHSQRAKELRHRIEHAEMLWDENIKRIRKIGLILSVQPNFAFKWSGKDGMNEKRLGEERLKKCNPYWDIQRALVKMVFGSDNMPMSPIFGLFSAVNHPVLEQRVSIYNALQSYIKDAAYAGGDEDILGTFTEDKKADFIVLSDNPLDIEDINDTEVVMTVINGKIVYDDH